MPQPAINTRKVQPGEVLLKSGQKITSVFVIQSGRISICQAKGAKLIEIMQMTDGQCIGEEALFGPSSWTLTALAVRPTTVVEIPVSLVQDQLKKSNPLLSSLLKGFSDRIKSSANDLKSLQTQREAQPCPPNMTAKVFAVIFHTAKAIGKPRDAALVVDWREFKQHAYEVFDEPTTRLENAVNILVKLAYARFEGKDALVLNEMTQIENFFDYYGNYHFKSGYADLLKTNSKMTRVTEEFLKIAEGYPVDRAGNAHIPYKSTVDAMKKAMGSAFEADQLFRLEQKGLFIKRTTTQEGGVLSFYKADFTQMLLNWRILREVELWNEHGFVQMGPKVESSVPAPAVEDQVQDRQKWSKMLAEWKPAAALSGGVPQIRKGDKAPGEIWCSVCMSIVNRNDTVCKVCGNEINQKAA